jgi:hypothetical protein
MHELKVCDDLSDDYGYRGFVVAITDKFVITADASDTGGHAGRVSRVLKSNAIVCRNHWLAAHPQEGVAGE